ncbi:unnamed protein product, partial [Ceratitis capitata]
FAAFKGLGIFMSSFSFDLWCLKYARLAKHSVLSGEKTSSEQTEPKSTEASYKPRREVFSGKPAHRMLALEFIGAAASARTSFISFWQTSHIFHSSKLSTFRLTKSNIRYIATSF